VLVFAVLISAWIEIGNSLLSINCSSEI